VVGLHLRPIPRDVVEILGVGGDLLKQRPGPFPLRQVLLLLVLAPTRAEQAVLAQDTLEGPVAQGQIPLPLQASGAESGQLAAQLDDAFSEFTGDLVRAGVRSAGEFL
jgi:hypothetical protein